MAASGFPSENLQGIRHIERCLSGRYAVRRIVGVGKVRVLDFVCLPVRGTMATG